jgi:hypothetical protein
LHIPRFFFIVEEWK